MFFGEPKMVRLCIASLRSTFILKARIHYNIFKEQLSFNLVLSCKQISKLKYLYAGLCTETQKFPRSEFTFKVEHFMPLESFYIIHPPKKLVF